MTKSALLRVSRIIDVDAVEKMKAGKVDPTMYFASGAVSPLHIRGQGIPVCVDHLKDHEVGHVERFFEIESEGSRWLVARAVIDRPPAWLMNRTACSISFYETFRNAAFGWVASALASEVSILSPGVRPAEEFARVLSLEDCVPSSPAAAGGHTSAFAAAGEDAARRWAAAAPPGVIRRPGIGRVISVR